MSHEFSSEVIKVGQQTLTKVADKLVDKISEGIDTVHRPRELVRVAKAESKAKEARRAIRLFE